MNLLRLLLPALCLTSGPLFAWDPVGHMLVNQIAYDQLTPAARAAVDAQIATFNKKENTDYTFTNLGCWMDDIRARTKDYNTWHYVNLPFTADGRPLPAEEEGPNVIYGVDLALAAMRGEKTDDMVPPVDALAIFTHLAGDIHQPLHATTRNDDAGGNRTKVSNLKDAESDLIFTGGGNLHFYWDSAYRRIYRNGKADVLFANTLYPRDKPLQGHKAALPLVRERATAIEEEFPRPADLQIKTPVDWALESHTIGFEFAYPALPETDEEAFSLDEAYVTKSRQIARQRIATAGYRMGEILNELYGGEEKNLKK